MNTPDILTTTSTNWTDITSLDMEARAPFVVFARTAVRLIKENAKVELRITVNDKPVRYASFTRV